MVIESSSLVPVLFREVFSHPYISFFHLLVNLFFLLLPYVILMKPMTDLCWKCQRNGSAIVWAANYSDVNKSATIEEALEHLRFVQVERSQYTTICKECEREISHSLPMTSLHHLPLTQEYQQTPETSGHTIHLITPNKFTSHLTPCSLVQFIFSPPEVQHFWSDL